MIVQSSVVNFAVVGSGSMATSLVANGLNRLENVKLVAAADIDESLLKKFCERFGVEAVKDPNSIFEREDVDAVILATPPSFRLDYIRRAAFNEKHVFSEKPLALSRAEAEECVQLAKEAKVVLGVGHVQRFGQPFAHIIDIAKSEELGKPLGLSIVRHGSPLGGRLKWREKRETCGNILFEINVHEIDTICEIMGCWPDYISAAAVPARPDITKTDHECSFSVNFYFSGGRFAHCFTSQIDVHGYRWGRLLFENGSLGYDYSSGILQTANRNGERKTISLKELTSEKTPHEKELGQFTEAILKGIEPVPGGNDGLRSVAIAEAATESARKNGMRMKVK